MTEIDDNLKKNLIFILCPEAIKEKDSESIYNTFKKLFKRSHSNKQMLMKRTHFSGNNKISDDIFKTIKSINEIIFPLVHEVYKLLEFKKIIYENSLVRKNESNIAALNALETFWHTVRTNYIKNIDSTIKYLETLIDDKINVEEISRLIEFYNSLSVEMKNKFLDGKIIVYPLNKIFLAKVNKNPITKVINTVKNELTSIETEAGIEKQTGDQSLLALPASEPQGRPKLLALSAPARPTLSHGDVCNKKEIGQTKKISGETLICKKSKSLFGRKIKSSLKKKTGTKSLGRYGKRLEKNECHKGPCWHKLSRLNKISRKLKRLRKTKTNSNNNNNNS
jgi:hypothetical protein